jgi:hypothetical protein
MEAESVSGRVSWESEVGIRAQGNIVDAIHIAQFLCDMSS